MLHPKGRLLPHRVLAQPIASWDGRDVTNLERPVW
jgi:hypothetical protein